MLLDRATRTIETRLVRARERLGRPARVMPLLVGTRLAAGRSALGAAAAGLAALGPQATLERGYAIVRRADDGRIVRDPGEVSGGERLAVRVARGEFGARVEPAEATGDP